VSLLWPCVRTTWSVELQVRIYVPGGGRPGCRDEHIRRRAPSQWSGWHHHSWHALSEAWELPIRAAFSTAARRLPVLSRPARSTTRITWSGVRTTRSPKSSTRASRGGVVGFTRWSAACRNRPSPLYAWLAWGGSCRPTPPPQACSAALVLALAPRRLAGAVLGGSCAGRTRRGDQTRPLTLARLYQARKEQAQATVAADATALWRGAVVKSMPGMLNGEVMLRGVKVGDRIEVLAEESGPGGAYLTARNVTTGQVGFYPAGWVRHPERGVPAQGPVAC